MQLIPHNLKINFMGLAWIAVPISFALMAMSVYLWIDMGDSKYGVDYRGGTEMVLAFNQSTDSEAIRKALDKAGFGEVVVQAFEEFSGGEVRQFSIRVGDDGDSGVVKAKVQDALKVNFSDKFSILKSDTVGPTIGEELRNKAFLAVTVSFIGILIYIWFRFESAFAFGAIIATLHDVVIATGIYLLCDRQITASYLAAALTLVGYSVNDTVIVFDRIREEILKHKDFDLNEVVNLAINSTLSRTVITSLLTLFSAAALLIYGGGAIADLSLFMVVGIIVGAYSSIFIASPYVVIWDYLFISKGKRKSKGKAQAKAA